MRVRNQLLILVLSVLVPALVASALAVSYVYTEEQEAQEQAMAETARTFALLIGNELQSKEGILRTLANSPALARGDLMDFYAYAKSMAPTSEATIILIDQNDKQVLNTRLPFGAELPAHRPSNLPEITKRNGPEKTIVSDVFFAPVGKRYDFTIQVPVTQSGEIRYFLVMGMNVSVLQPLLAQRHFPQQWLASVIDRNGVVVARSRDAEQYAGKLARENTRNRLSSTREGVYQSVTLDGIPSKTFFSRVPLADWSVLVSIPEAEIQRVPIRAAAFLAFIMAALLALTVVTARRVANRVIRPMEQLGDSAERMAQGEAVAYIPQGLQEVDSVGERIADASRQIRHNKLELEQRVADAVAATERVERALLQSQKLEALGRLTGGIAHEFNNLLQTLVTALQLAKMISNQERVQSLIETCGRAIDRATVLTGQLGSFGRVQDARLVTVNLGEQIGIFQQLLKNVLPANIGLEIRLPELLWPVTIDSVQLELALLNIAINARDAMPDGGALTLEAGNHALKDLPDALPAGDYVRIRISDTGSGMAPDVLAKALDPFFTTKSIGQGTGLGLPQAYGFARQSRGTLLLRSTEGEGTVVDIYLPKTKEPLTERLQRQREEEERMPARGTVLFVEDDPLVREAVAPALEAAGFTILMAATADEALTLLDSGNPADVVFSDILMPGQIDGIGLAGVVRDRFPAMKVVLATGYTDQRVALPDVDILAKPYEIADAVQILHAAVLAKG